MPILKLPASLRTFNRESLPVLHRRISGRDMLADIRAMVATDRWNSFDGFHETARYVAEQYRRLHAVAETYVVPTAGPDGSGRWVIQEASDIHAATVDVVSPVRRRIADFKQNPWNVVQWTAATARGGVRSEVVVIDTWEQLRAVRAGTLRGKMILTSLSPWHAGHVFERTGADGVLAAVPVGTGFGSPPRTCNMSHATEWTKLGWGGHPMEHAGCHVVALALSQDTGQWLRRLVAKTGRVLVHTRVDARRYVGTHDLVSGIVRGSGDPQDEVWVLSHNAEPGAADDSSGVAACMASAGAIERAIRDGRLARPRRSIRFLNGYECYSFFHYMEHVKRLQPPLAGLVVDTIGHRPVHCEGRVNWHSTLDSSATFVNEIGEGTILAALALDNPGYHLVRQAFLSTEDTLAGDPKFGFPCPWINTHYRKDKVGFDAYHTSDDTPALLSPRGLRTCATAVAGYVYYLANAGTRELVEMARAHTHNVLADMAAHRRRRAGVPPAGRGWAEFRALQHHVSLERLRRWAWGGDRGSILGELSRLEGEVAGAAEAFGRAPRATRVMPGLRRVPVRTAPLAPDVENLRPAVRQRLRDSGLGRHPLFWADGRRSLAEIAALHAHEIGRPVKPEQVEAYFEAMDAANYVDLISPSQMVTKAVLVRDLRRLGLKPGMDVMAHSSLSRIGHVAGGVDTVIDALLAVLGARGTLLMPSFNHGLATVYNPLTTPTINGAISDAFWRRPAAVRSLQGTHAVAAIGPRAASYCAGHVEAGIWSSDSPIGRLIHGGGHILGLGVTLVTATAYHIAEVSVPCQCLDLKGGTDERVSGDGQVVTQPGLVWRGGDCPVGPEKMQPDLERLGQARRGKVGHAESVLVKALDLWRVRRRHLAKACPSCKVRPDLKWKAKA
ncbi:MAG: AAC(3) family N-acetyltransferase [Lentisphaerae bacterium]|nr:AAC(3) family N-acetyltransferase [Lentisphaerota bacterium]